MKILLPSLTTHTINIRPRVYPTGTLSLAITKEVTGVITTVTPTYVIVNDVMTLTFDLTGLESERFTVKLTEGAVIIYRCKLFFTAQTPQDYKITLNEFIYA
jgi:hypothetical protein